MTQTTPSVADGDLTAADTARTVASGIDLSALDPAVRPQDDLYRHVNGRWLETHEIPADRSMDGAFRALHDQAEEHVREIIKDAAAAVEAGNATGVQAQIGALFASFMDTDTIEARGVSPLAPDLALLAAATSQAELTGALGALQRTGGAGAFGFWVDNDAKDPEKYVAYLYQGGLGLPDEAYYREDQYAEIRAKYVPHVARMLTLAGVTPDTWGASRRTRPSACSPSRRSSRHTTGTSCGTATPTSRTTP